MGTAGFLVARFDLQLVVDVVFTGDLAGLGRDGGLFLRRLDGPPQLHLAFADDDLDVFGVHRERIVFDDRLADALDERQVLLAIGLLLGGVGLAVLV